MNRQIAVAFSMIIIGASQLQDYIDDGSIEGEFKLPLRFLENECHR